MTTARSRLTQAAAVLLVATGAFAAPDAPASAPTTEEAQNLSAQDTLTKAKESVSKMQDTLRDIVGLQEQAKKQKDIIKLNCVNDKFTQTKGHIAVADQAMGNLNEAIGKSDDDARKHEYQRVEILYQKVLVLGTEARNCVGDDLSYIGATTVTETTDSTIPQKDYTAFNLPSTDTTRPPVASSP